MNKPVIRFLAAGILLGAASTAFAASGSGSFTVGTATTVDNSGATTFTYPEGGGFVQNEFDFTISASVVFNSAENNQAMGVVAGSSRGRYVFTGSSNGGSVSACNEDPITTTSGPAAAIDTYFDTGLTENNACSSGS